MRKLLLNPTPLFRKLRQLSLLLSLLLALPQTAWGQTTYDKGTYNSENNTWGNWQVAATGTTISSSGDNNLSFNVVNNTTATITLTLENPGTTSEKICYAHFAYNQNENIPADNKVKLLSAKIVHTNSSVTDLTNDFKEYTKSCSFFAKTPVEWSSRDNFVVTLQVNNTTGASTSHTIQAAQLKTGTPYGLIVNGITVTNVNQNCVNNLTTNFNGQNEVAEVVFTPEEGSNPATLTLTQAELDVSSANIAAIESSLGSLKVILAGENKIKCGNNKAFNLADNSSLTITTNGTNTGQLTITSTSSITTESFYSPSTANVTYTGLVASNPTSTSVLISPLTSYDITIAGIAVTNANASAITGTGITTGTVSYDATTNTLTLNGATINGKIDYNGTTDFTIAINGSNSIVYTTGSSAIFTNTQATYSFNFVKAAGASSAELSIEAGNGSTVPISATNPTLGSGLYWKPTAQNIMVITENPDFVLYSGYAMTNGQSESEGGGTLVYTESGSEKTLTFTNFKGAFGNSTTPVNAIETGVVGLKVILVGNNKITCNDAGTFAFKSFQSNASIQFVKGGDGCKLTMDTKTDNPLSFGDGKVTYDQLIYYSSNGNEKYICEPTAPVISKATIYDATAQQAYTFAKIDYATSDKEGGNVKYASANPKLMYSFDYADANLTDVTNAEYPGGNGIKMLSPGVLTAWVEVGDAKSTESKGVRFGFLENPIEMEFNGTAKQISITPAPTMTSAVTPSVSSDYSGLFNNFATLDAANKITIKSCYDGKIGFIFDNGDGYTSLNDSTLVTFKITPPKPTISVPGGTYDAAQTVTIASNYQGTGATIKYYFGENPTAEQTYSADLSITTTQTLTAWVEVNGVKSDTVQAPYTIRQAANLSYSATTATAKIQAGGTTFTAPTLDNPLGINGITYSSSNEQVATISNTGDVTILGAGTTTISAKATDETTYTPTPAEYALTVTRVISNPFSNAQAGQNYATYYSNTAEDLALPAGLEAYIVTGVSGTSVVATSVSYLPHATPILLQKTADLNADIEIGGYDGTAGNFAGNMLKHANAVVNTTGKEYILYKNEFVKATGDISAGSCYLDLGGTNLPARGVLGIGNDGSTGIEGIDVEATKDEEWYDLQGRRIQQPMKAGIYIVNGKKVIINKK